MVPNSDLTEPREGELNKSSPSHGKGEAKKTTTDNASNPDSVHQDHVAIIPMIRESIWEGAIQLNVSSLSNVVAIFKRCVFICAFCFLMTDHLYVRPLLTPFFSS